MNKLIYSDQGKGSMKNKQTKKDQSTLRSLETFIIVLIFWKIISPFHVLIKNHLFKRQESKAAHSWATIKKKLYITPKMLRKITK